MTYRQDRSVYEELPKSTRRLVNQAVFLALIVSDPDGIQAQLTPLYETVAQLTQELRHAKEAAQTAQKQPRTPQTKPGRPQDDLDPEIRGRGSYINSMAERARFELAIRSPAYTLSKRAPSATRPPLHGWCVTREL
jgi:hypothetical protein